MYHTDGAGFVGYRARHRPRCSIEDQCLLGCFGAGHRSRHRHRLPGPTVFGLAEPEATQDLGSRSCLWHRRCFVLHLFGSRSGRDGLRVQSLDRYLQHPGLFSLSLPPCRAWNEGSAGHRARRRTGGSTGAEQPASRVRRELGLQPRRCLRRVRCRLAKSLRLFSKWDGPQGSGTVALRLSLQVGANLDSQAGHF